jgi:transposase
VEEVVTIRVLAEKGANHCQIGRAVGVSEGTVRYHLRRAADGAEDGRRRQARRAAGVAEAIQVWMEARRDEPRPANVRELYEHLVTAHDYAGSYNSVRRYVRAHYPKPKLRTYRRVETPPGAQTQTDWAEYPRIDVGDGPEPLHAFVMVLSHSRKPAVVWSRDEQLLAWLACHNATYRRLGGVAAVNRIDNLKTAMASGAGAWGTIHPAYRAYARAVGFHVDACPPRSPQAKGKGEAKVKLSRQLVDVRRRYDGIEELQGETDARIERWARRAICPATGETVQASYERECERLAPLPILPEPFDVAVTRGVAPDCTLAFEAHRYSVPFRLVGRQLEVRGCAATVQVLADGQVVATHPRHTRERLVIDPAHYEGAATAEVAPPPPLGRMGRRLLEIAGFGRAAGVGLEVARALQELAVVGPDPGVDVVPVVHGRASLPCPCRGHPSIDARGGSTMHRARRPDRARGAGDAGGRRGPPAVDGVRHRGAARLPVPGRPAERAALPRGREPVWAPRP